MITIQEMKNHYTSDSILPINALFSIGLRTSLSLLEEGFSPFLWENCTWLAIAADLKCHFFVVDPK